MFALINLALLTGHVGRYGSGLVPLRGQNNVQGGGDMGAIPAKLPGGYDLGDDEARGRYERAWGVSISPKPGMHLSQMFDAMNDGTLKALYCIGENPAESEANATHARHLLEGLDHLVVQDIFRTATADMADVVLPAAADWCEYEGTVTNSERRVQRVRKAIDPPGQAWPDTHIICGIAERLGHPWGRPSAEEVWDELRSLSLNWHHGMSYARLDAMGGIQWPCPAEDHPGTPLLHARLWADDPAERGTPAPFTPVEHVPPVDVLTEEFPIRLTTVRVLDAYNSGVQTGGYASPLRRREALRMDAERRCEARHRRRRARAGGVAAWGGGGPGVVRPVAAARAGLVHAALLRRGRHQRPDERRVGSQVGHLGVQGDGGPGREAHRDDVSGRKLTRQAPSLHFAPLRYTSHPIDGVRSDHEGCEVARACPPTPHSAPDMAGWRGGLAALRRGADRRRAAGDRDVFAARRAPTTCGGGQRSPTAGTPPAVAAHLLPPVLHAVTAAVGLALRWAR